MTPRSHSGVTPLISRLTASCLTGERTSRGPGHAFCGERWALFKSTTSTILGFFRSSCPPPASEPNDNDRLRLTPEAFEAFCTGVNGTLRWGLPEAGGAGWAVEEGRVCGSLARRVETGAARGGDGPAFAAAGAGADVGGRLRGSAVRPEGAEAGGRDGPAAATVGVGTWGGLGRAPCISAKRAVTSIAGALVDVCASDGPWCRARAATTLVVGRIGGRGGSGMGGLLRGWLGPASALSWVLSLGLSSLYCRVGELGEDGLEDLSLQKCRGFSQRERSRLRVPSRRGIGGWSGKR